MKKTIRINHLEDVQDDDILFVKGRSDGFRVECVTTGSFSFPVSVDNPFNDGIAYVRSDRFDHAERTVEEPEWPTPSDFEMHVYLGADGKQYIYAPSYEGDPVPWKQLPYYRINGWHSAGEMTEYYPEALPLTELKLVPKEEES